MFNPAREAIVSQIDDAIAELLARSVRYQDVNSFEVRRLLSEAKKMIPVDAYSAYLSIGNIYHLCGDYEQMRYNHQNAAKLRHNVDTHGWAAACECNLGFNRRAQEHFKVVGDPRQGAFSRAFVLGIASGAFHQLAEYIEQADKMELDMSALPVEVVLKAHAVLEAAGVSDSEAAAMLDIAGEVMREKQIFYTGDLSNIAVHKEDDILNSYVHVAYRIALPGKEVAAMSMSLAEKIAERIEHIPEQLLVTFRPAA